MALRIWCDPEYFPAEQREAAIAAAIGVLAARDVTLEQARQAYAYVERMCDMPDLENQFPEHALAWEDAWFGAIAAAEAAAGVPRCHLGAVLVLDDADERFLAARPD